MSTVLVDHDMEGEAALLWDALAAEGWLALATIRLVRFTDVGLPVASPDRMVWRFVQRQQMTLLTGNRNMEGADSFERTIREEVTPDSLPVLTIGNRDRVIEREYRVRCAERLVEVVLYPERYRGAGRIFIP